VVWRAVTRSSVGISHRKQQMPCQDYGDWKIMNNVIIGAVADGAGSAKYADIGAKLAVKTVLGYLTGIEAWLQKRKRFYHSSPLSEPEARKVFAKTVKKVLSALQKQATQEGYAIADLACTLLVVIGTPTSVAAMQIGDGFIVVRCQSSEPQLLFQPEKGEYLNQTTFVTSANALESMQVSVCLGQQEFICVATDGLERVAIRMSDWTPFTPFFQPLEEYLRENSILDREDEYLMNFLDSDRLNARTDDDKTLLLGFYSS